MLLYFFYFSKKKADLPKNDEFVSFGISSTLYSRKICYPKKIVFKVFDKFTNFELPSTLLPYI